MESWDGQEGGGEGGSQASCEPVESRNHGVLGWSQHEKHAGDSVAAGSAQGGSRTHMTVKSADFESAASAIPPLGLRPKNRRHPPRGQGSAIVVVAQPNRGTEYLTPNHCLSQGKP